MLLRFFVIFSVFMFSACGSMQSRDKAEKLDSTFKRYDAALRWSRIRDAAGYHVNRDGQPLVVDIKYAEKFSVTGIDILERTMDPEFTEAIILVEISYYDKEFGVLRKIRHEQLWWLNAQNNSWFIESEFPAFK